MTFVITQNCCNDASCVPVCPVNCIHPTPDDPEYATTEMLYIDPDACIECGACLDACPVGAIEPDYDLPESSLPFIELNSVYYRDPAHLDYEQVPYAAQPARSWKGSAPLRVAIVGAGPASSYAVEHLLAQRGLDVQIDVFEKLMTPWGLLRHGVAPDHQSTKKAADAFTRSMRHRAVRVFFDVDVGVDISFAELAERYHAVLYGVGAASDRRVLIPGEDLPGSMAATQLVAWYNGHPDGLAHQPDLSADRAIVVGNGNVALDVARILASDVDALRKTDIAEHSLDVLSESRIREVRVLGRRGADVAAFTTPELIGLREALGPRLIRSEEIGEPSPESSVMALYKRELIEKLPTQAPLSDEPIVVLDFCRTPVSVVGDSAVRGLRYVPTGGGDADDLECGLLVRAVGYRSEPIAGLPFDAERAVVPNDEGRVTRIDGEVVAGAYVTGWIKRGPSGALGTNRRCAKATVSSLLDDFGAARLAEPAVADDIAERFTKAVSFDDWRHLDSHERASGHAAGRLRLKTVNRDEQRSIVASRES
ncbi:4Fe-4S binding protein [Gordonia sp. NPDC058843]|uniref:4Fe-4S binding protein n=1 Tax=Gordonia sp. NPDC058843 TaxID=3346648 RepID=UPI00368C305A